MSFSSCLLCRPSADPDDQLGDEPATVATVALSDAPVVSPVIPGTGSVLEQKRPSALFEVRESLGRKESLGSQDEHPADGCLEATGSGPDEDMSPTKEVRFRIDAEEPLQEPQAEPPVEGSADKHEAKERDGTTEGVAGESGASAAPQEEEDKGAAEEDPGAKECRANSKASQHSQYSEKSCDGDDLSPTCTPRAELSPEERLQVWRAASKEDRLMKGEELVSATAAKTTSAKKVRRIIMTGVHVDATNAEGECALRIAAVNGRSNIVKMLVSEFGAKINGQNTLNNDSALHLAAGAKKESTVKCLVELKANCGLKNNSGETALDLLKVWKPELEKWAMSRIGSTKGKADMKNVGDELVQAATNGDIQVIRELVMQGANIDTPDSDGSCALRRAARTGQAELLRILLTECGADINARNRHNNETALHFACKHHRTDCVRLLVEFHADLSMRNKAKKTPLDLVKKERNKDLAEWLREKQQELEVAEDTAGDKDIGDKLVQAAGKGDIGAVRKLIGKGANVEMEDGEGRNPLRNAALHGQSKIIQFLLSDCSAKINAACARTGDTALHCACKKNKEDTVKMLVDLGADLVMPNSTGALPSDLLQKKNPELAKFLVDTAKKEADMDETERGERMVEAAIKGDIKVIRAMSARGANIDSEDADGRCALRTAAREGQTQLVSMLLNEFGANINSTNHFNGDTALHLACKFNRQVTIQYLVERSADVNTQNKKGETPLDVLKARGNHELQQWALQYSQEEKKSTRRQQPARGKVKGSKTQEPSGRPDPSPMTSPSGSPRSPSRSKKTSKVIKSVGPPPPDAQERAKKQLEKKPTNEEQLVK